MNPTKNGGAPARVAADAPSTENCKESTEQGSPTAITQADLGTPVQAALAYLRCGIAPIPLHTPRDDGTCSCGRPTCSNPGKHPRIKWKQYQKTLPTPEQVTEWWEKWPDANVGLSSEQFVIIDVDGKEGYIALAEAGFDLPETTTVTSGRGEHRYYAAPSDVDQVRNDVGIVEKVDRRAAGGIIVAPPSRHASGVNYEWAGLPDFSVLAPCPEWAIPKKSAPTKTAAKAVEHGPAPLVGGLTDRRDLLLRLDQRCAQVRWATEGTRNNTLNIAAFVCGSLLRLGLDREVAAGRLLQAAIESGLEPRHSHDTIERALTDGLERAGDFHKCDEQALAARFVAIFGGIARFAGDEGRWLLFDGKRWDHDTPSHHRAAKMMEAVVDLYVEDANAAQDPKVADAYYKFAKSYRTNGKVTSALKTAERHLLVASDDFDRVPGVLNVDNGTLDMASGTLRPANAEDLITRLAGVAYDPDAKAPRFESFLAQVLPDAEVRDWLQRFIGYTMAGDPKEQCFCTLLGDGSNGKSTLIGALSCALGDYAMATQADTFTSSGRTTLPAQELARMGHATRLVFTSEPAPGAHLDESFIKQFTGGDTIVAKGLYAPPRSFRPQATLVMAVNEPLELSTSNVALSRRIKVVPFNVTITDRKRQRDLGAELAGEAAGVLNWVVAGYQAYLARGLEGEPHQLREAAEDYIRSSDTFADFLDEGCEFRADARISRTEMYSTYAHWCYVRSITARSNRAVISTLRGMGVAERKSRGVWCWLGVRTVVDAMRSIELLVDAEEAA